MEALYRRSTDSTNLKGLKTLVMELEEIPSSTDVERDLSMVIIDRNMIDYISPMLWCNIFLRGMGLGGSSGTPLPFALIIRSDVLFGAYVARKSSARREDGSFLIKYGADIRADGGSSGVSVITIDLDWSFYNRVKNTTERDAEMMFMSAPGYRVIPRAIGTDRLMAMARSYLADSLV